MHPLFLLLVIVLAGVFLLVQPAATVMEDLGRNTAARKASADLMLLCLDRLLQTSPGNRRTTDTLVAELSASTTYCSPRQKRPTHWQIRSAANRFVAGTIDSPLPEGLVRLEAGAAGIREIPQGGRPVITAVTRHRSAADESGGVFVEIGTEADLTAGMPVRPLIQIGALLAILAAGALLLVAQRRDRRLLSQRLIAHCERDLSPIPPAIVPEGYEAFVQVLNKTILRLRTHTDTQKRFFANAAHQLKTPLAGLKIQVEYAATRRNSNEVCLAMQNVSESVSRINAMVHHLLELAALDDPESLREQFKPVDLHATSLDVIDQAYPLALRLGKIIEFDTDGDVACIRGHPTFIREMLQNLVDNAIKHSDPGSAVRIGLYSRRCAGCVWQVENDAPPIPRTFKKRLFERFYSGADSQAPNCSGLGLSVVLECAALHQVTISIEDLRDDAERTTHGVRFSLHFPTTLEHGGRQ